MHTERLLEVTFGLLGVESGAKMDTLGRCELCVYVHRQRCRLTRLERSQRCEVVILYRKVNFPGESWKHIPTLRCGFCLCLVSDGEHTTPEMVFVIHLLSADQQPPVFQITAPLLEVSQGGKATIGE